MSCPAYFVFTTMQCRRWNNTVSLTLRALVYDPILEGRFIKQQQQQTGKAARTPMWLRLAGMAATFTGTLYM
jgi:uncharacterized membrane protein